MLYGLWSSAAGGIAQNAQVDSIAHNLANLQTAGFRKELLAFRARQAETAEDLQDLHQVNSVLDRIGGGLFVDRSYWDKLPGAIEQTGRNLDVALDGPGFFMVQRDGRTYYTRAGNFAVDQEGFLRTADGAGLVLDDGGKEILLENPAAADIDAGGVIRIAGSEVAALGRADFADLDSLAKVGDTLFEYRGRDEVQPSTATVVQGSLEASTADPVGEMTRMILAQRSYEANAQMIRFQDQTLERAVNDLGRLPR